MKQYAVSLLVIVTIAAVDNLVIIEFTPPAADMVWVDGSDFTTTAESGFTEADASQDFQNAGFWIDSSIVSNAAYETFLDESGYISTTPVELSVAVQSPDSLKRTIKAEQIFALYESSADEANQESLARYISSSDAMAYCNWKGMELSSREQVASLAHTGSAAINPAAPEITLHASHPLSDLSGFRCVKISH